MPNKIQRESELYAPVCHYLEAQGYRVQGEVHHCDLVAVRGEEPPLIVELKTTLNLTLVMQAVDRLALSDSVYIAFPAAAPLWKRNWRRLRALCRRLGIGIITLEGKSLKVKIRLDPLPYRPRKSQQRCYRLLAEFEHRVSDANVGGVTREPIMTAYRQDALRCAGALANGPLALAEIRQTADVARAASIMQKDHYGWFERVRRGHYALSPQGEKALRSYAGVLQKLEA